MGKCLVGQHNAVIQIEDKEPADQIVQR
jgi:hypothetical protein